MLTLQEFSDRFVTPWVLNHLGLPDSPEGHEIMDRFVEAALNAVEDD